MVRNTAWVLGAALLLGGCPAQLVLVTDSLLIAPELSPAPGIYSTAQMVTISTATTGATLHYTLDGTPPGLAGTIYEDPIRIRGDYSVVEVNAVAVLDGVHVSEVVGGAYEIAYPPTPSPTFSVIPGTYNSDQDVQVFANESTDTIYYTIDGTTPSELSAVYSQAIPVAGHGTVYQAT
jgi:hypothetical protein